MISDILDFGRLNKGQFKINIQKFDIENLIEGITDLLQI